MQLKKQKLLTRSKSLRLIVVPFCPWSPASPLLLFVSIMHPSETAILSVLKVSSPLPDKFFWFDFGDVREVLLLSIALADWLSITSNVSSSSFTSSSLERISSGKPLNRKHNNPDKGSQSHTLERFSITVRF